MLQKSVVNALVLLSGLMAGILLECRVFHPLRSFGKTTETTNRPTYLPDIDTSLPVGASFLGSEGSIGPRILADEPDYKFETTETGSKVTHTFIIRNVGSKPLVITQVQAACGCTTTNSVDRPIEAGGVSEITAVLDLKGRVGPQMSSIAVRSNDPMQPELRLSIAGTAVSSVMIAPESLDFGRITQANPAKAMPVTIRFDPGFMLKILNTASSHDEIVVEFDESAPTSIKVSVLPTVAAGPLHGWVKLLTDHPDTYRELLIRITAYVGPGGPILAGDNLDISGPTLGGGTADLNSLRGSITILAFWSSGCGHCLSEIPELVALDKQYHSKGLRILGVNCDTEKVKATAAVAKLKIPWPNIHFESSKDEQVPNPLMAKYEINGIPALFVIDRTGRVKWIGLRKAALKLRVEQLLNEREVASEN